MVLFIGQCTYIVRYIYFRSLLPSKIGLPSDTSTGIYFAPPLEHKASCGSIMDYPSDNFNRQPFVNVAAKAGRISQRRQANIGAVSSMPRCKEKRAQVIHYQAVDID